MIFATILSLLLLAAVIATVHAEQRSEQSVAASSRRTPALGDVDDLAALVDAPLPRAVLGYEPLAVRSRLAAMHQAYARLAAECGPGAVERAWVGVGNETPAGGDQPPARADAEEDRGVAPADAEARRGANTNGS